MVRAAAIVMVASLVAVGCAADGSADTDALRVERDEVEADLDDALAELEDVRAELDGVDDELAVANARLEEAEAAAESASGAATDLDEFLTLDVMNRVGLDRAQSECVSEVFAADEDLRRSYLLLLDQERAQADSGAATAAFESVTVVLQDCGLDTTSPDEAAEQTAADQAALVELLGDVQVEGDPLPQFVDGSDPSLGTPAPVLIGFDYRGEPVTVDGAGNGPTMVVVVAHWCPHCNAEIPKLLQLRDEGKVPEGVNVVAVSSALNPEAPNFPPDQWLADYGWPWPVLADGLDVESGSFIAYRAYGVSGVPFVVLLDGRGNVVQRWAGERDLAFLETALLTLAEIG